MLMVRAIIRPEKVSEVLDKISEAGLPAVTKVDVVGRGKQKGIRFGDIYYDEIPKEMLIMIIKDEDKDRLVELVMEAARSGEDGAFGDGKIFVSAVEEAYTISSGSKGL